MPSKGLLYAFGAGVAAVAVLVAVIMYMQRGAHIRLEGGIQHVRTVAMDDYSSVLVADFRFANPADYPFVVRRVDVTIVDADGHVYDGASISEVDTLRVFEHYKGLGQKFNDTLLMGDTVAPHSTEDRMIAARFAVPQRILDGRRSVTVRVEEVDGAVAEFSQSR
jgi:hypothetical protein